MSKENVSSVIPEPGKQVQVMFESDTAPTWYDGHVVERECGCFSFHFDDDEIAHSYSGGSATYVLFRDPPTE